MAKDREPHKLKVSLNKPVLQSGPVQKKYLKKRFLTYSLSGQMTTRKNLIHIHYFIKNEKIFRFIQD